DVSWLFTADVLFFFRVAVISFGGAYAVLAYVAHEVVRRFALSPDDVVAGLALAETTPGPLILVVEFYGFLAAYRNPGTLAPAAAGAIGAAVTVWASFAPCFLWSSSARRGSNGTFAATVNARLPITPTTAAVTAASAP